jgi:hypothetical protein
MKHFSGPITALALCLAACTTPQPDEEQVVRKAQEVTPMHVHSLPPGCFVELNNEFMGVTPVTIRVPSYEGKWTGTMYKLHRLRVSMPRGGGYEEKRWFGYDPIPQRAVFRIPGAETWHHANSPKPRTKPTLVGQ